MKQPIDMTSKEYALWLYERQHGLGNNNVSTGLQHTNPYLGTSEGMANLPDPHGAKLMADALDQREKTKEVLNIDYAKGREHGFFCGFALAAVVFSFILWLTWWLK